MCDLRKWYIDENGYVFQCADCRHFQVCFGTTVLTLEEKEFHQFVLIVADRRESISDYAELPCKCIMLPTPSAQVQCVLTGMELAMLHQMLQETDVEIKTAQMMRMLQGNS